MATHILIKIKKELNLKKELMTYKSNKFFILYIFSYLCFSNIIICNK